MNTKQRLILMKLFDRQNKNPKLLKNLGISIKITEVKEKKNEQICHR